MSFLCFSKSVELESGSGFFSLGNIGDTEAWILFLLEFAFLAGCESEASGCTLDFEPYAPAFGKTFYDTFFGGFGTLTFFFFILSKHFFWLQ